MSYDEHLISMAGGDGELDLDAIEARAQAASPGPWGYGTGYSADGGQQLTAKADKADFLALSLNDDEAPLWVIDNGDVIPAATGDGPRAKANAAFIANARTDVPALLALVREQQDQLDRVLELAYWAGKRGWQIAPATLRNTINEVSA